MAADLEADAFAADLERFAEDEFIQQALGDGVDLQGYSRCDDPPKQFDCSKNGDYI
jgi:hypothetical protein